MQQVQYELVKVRNESYGHGGLGKDEGDVSLIIYGFYTILLRLV